MALTFSFADYLFLTENFHRIVFLVLSKQFLYSRINLSEIAIAFFVFPGQLRFRCHCVHHLDNLCCCSLHIRIFSASHSRQHSTSECRAFFILKNIHLQIHYIGNDLTPQRALRTAAADFRSLRADTETSGYLQRISQTKTTPSRTAWVISSLVVSIDMPMNIALASGLLWGERSPIRYGRK